VATLAFTVHTRCSVYRVLFEECQWQALVELFQRDLYRMNCLTPESLLIVHLQAGLSALNTPVAYKVRSVWKLPGLGHSCAIGAFLASVVYCAAAVACY
jgi:hypothetical protein